MVFCCCRRRDVVAEAVLEKQAEVDELRARLDALRAETDEELSRLRAELAAYRGDDDAREELAERERAQRSAADAAEAARRARVLAKFVGRMRSKGLYLTWSGVAARRRRRRG